MGQHFTQITNAQNIEIFFVQEESDLYICEKILTVISNFAILILSYTQFCNTFVYKNKLKNRDNEIGWNFGMQ